MKVWRCLKIIVEAAAVTMFINFQLWVVCCMDKRRLIPVDEWLSGAGPYQKLGPRR